MESFVLLKDGDLGELRFKMDARKFLLQWVEWLKGPNETDTFVTFCYAWLVTSRSRISGCHNHEITSIIIDAFQLLNA